MTKETWDGQELFSYDGRFVFIIEYVETDYVRVADFETGKALPEFVFQPNLESATPEELEEIA